MKLRMLSEEHNNFLFVDDEFDEIADIPWDSGYTPQQALDHIRASEYPELTDSYDIGSIKSAISKIEKHGGIPPNMAITVNYDMNVVDGYHRIVAAKILGIQKIPYISV